MDNNSTEGSYAAIIKLIFDNAKDSVKEIDNSINLLNTKLSAVTGFSAVLIKFVGDLPDQSLTISLPDGSDPIGCTSCLILKTLSCVLLVIATFISLRGLLPKEGGGKILSPLEQVEKCLDLSEDEFRLLLVQEFDEDIQDLVKMRDWKAQRLSWAGEALVAAAIVSAIDSVLALWLK